MFRSHDLSGVAKVLWLLFMIVTPYLGVFVYLIVRGGGMAERQLEVAQKHEAALRGYIQEAAGGGSVADGLVRLADLKERGLIDDAEYAAGKAELLA